jgi:hypothetical protein
MTVPVVAGGRRTVAAVSSYQVQVDDDFAGAAEQTLTRMPASLR